MNTEPVLTPDTLKAAVLKGYQQGTTDFFELWVFFGRCIKRLFSG